ncbi:VanW family protein [Georgenia alba]|uniref:VanW family protein n=1 Tax=Georgenia alba TaxID=2233858 RepID=A0ABW2Q8A0_9MICO
MSDLDRVLDRRQQDGEDAPPPPPDAAPPPPPDATPSDAEAPEDTHRYEDAGRPGQDVPPGPGRDAPQEDGASTAVVPAVSDTPGGNTTDGGSPLVGFEEERPRRGRRRALTALVVLVVLAAAYVGVAWFLGDRVPNGTTVAGVPIGGMPAAEARSTLDEELGPVAREPIPVTVGDGVSSIDPAATGMTFDAAATTDELVGFTLDPRVLWGRLFGLGAVEPVTTVDEPALRESLTSAATELDVAPVEGAIAYSGVSPDVTEPEPGTAVDVDAAVTAVADRWLTEERPLELPTEEVPPTVGQDAVQSALEDLAEPLVSGPVTVKVGDRIAEVPPEQLARHATFVADGDRLRLELDGERLADAVVDINPDIEVAGEDARIVLGSDGPEIQPSTTGRGFDPERLADAVHEAGTSSRRTAEVQLVESEPEFTTEDAEALGVHEVIAEFSTPMPYDPVRTSNLETGAAKASGTLVMPGEEFSLLDAIGPISEANGYVSSGVVEDGFESTATGGGLSQLSTTLYNVAFLAGMDDVAHTPHSRWFDRYPQGREATLWEPSTDMVWRNNTDHGVLVEAWVSSDQVHARLWGTDVWDVETWTSDPYDVVEPQTVYNPSPECIPESGGQSGFSVTVTRQRSRDGGPVDEQTWNWTYSPWNHVVCGSPPSDEERSGGGDGGGRNGGGNGGGD